MQTYNAIMLGQIADFREGGSRYGPPKAVPGRGVGGILPLKWKFLAF